MKRKTLTLKHLSSINAGYPFRGKIPEAGGSGVVVVQMKDTSYRRGINWQSCIEAKLSGKREPDWLQPGDILVAARGSHNYAVQVDDTLLATAYQAVAAPHFFVVRTNKAQILPEFLAWLLNQKPCQRYFEQNAEGSQTKSIRRRVLEDTPIALPPLEKQQTIIHLADTIRKEQQLIEQLLHNGEQLLSVIANDLLNEPRI